MKKYRFFYHYRRQDGLMSVHFRKKCTPIRDVECRVKSETKRNKEQPRLVIQGFATDIIFENDKAIIV